MSATEPNPNAEQLKADVQAILADVKVKVDAIVTEALQKVDEAIHARLDAE